MERLLSAVAKGGMEERSCCELLEILFELRGSRCPLPGFYTSFFMRIESSRSYETGVDVGFFGISTDLRTR